MRGTVIEGGLYLLLIFAPFAFGGVELWALGVIQILSTLVFVAWAWGAWKPGADLDLATGAPAPGATASVPRRFIPSLWIPIGLFLLLVAGQLVPLPSGFLQAISPATHDLYTRTVPGYVDGEEVPVTDFPGWLIRSQEGRFPEGLAAGETPIPSPAELEASGLPLTPFGARPLSIFAPRTRERLTLFLCFTAIFAVVIGHFRTRERLARLTGMLIFSAFAVSLFGILQKLTWNEKLFWIREGNYTNPFGPFVNRNHYAAFAEIALPVAICIALGAWRKVRRGQETELPRLILAAFAAAVIGVGIFFSLSRGGMIAASLSAALVALLLSYYGRHGIELLFLVVLLAGVAALLIWIAPGEVVERVGTMSEGQSDPSLALRLTAWQRTLNLIGDFPILGAGLGTFRFAFMRYGPPGKVWWTTAHNEYLEILCDVGLLGGLLLLAGALVYFRRVLRPVLFVQRDGRYVYTGLIAGIGAILFHSAISSVMQIPANGIALVVAAGVALNLVLHHEANPKKHRSGEEPEERRHGSRHGRRRRR